MYRNFILLITSFLFFATTAHSQSFQKEIVNYASDVMVKSNGDIGVAGGASYFLFDSAGVEKWASYFNGQYSISCSQQSDNNSILLVGNGEFQTTLQNTFVVVKKDSLGNTVWAKAYTDTSFDVKYIEGSFPYQNGLIFYGRVQIHTQFSNQQGIVCRIDSNGNLLWNKWLDFGLGYPWRGAFTSDDKMLLINEGSIIKMDTNGTIIWTRSTVPPISFETRFVNICQSPLGFYTILAEQDTGGIVVINIDTSGNFMDGSIYNSTNLINGTVPTTCDIKYMSDSTLIIFAETGLSSIPSFEYTFYHLDQFQEPINASYLGISLIDNTSYKLLTNKNGFIALGNDVSADKSHIIKVDDPYQIDCAGSFQFTRDTFSISFINTFFNSVNALSSYSFNEFSFQYASQSNNYCGTTGIIEPDLKEVKVYPNPVTERLSISWKGYSIPSVKIYNQFGQSIKFQSEQNANQIEINLNSVPAGIYFITMSFKNSIVTRKIIKSE